MQRNRSSVCQRILIVMLVQVSMTFIIYLPMPYRIKIIILFPQRTNEIFIHSYANRDVCLFLLLFLFLILLTTVTRYGHSYTSRFTFMYNYIPSSLLCMYVVYTRQSLIMLLVAFLSMICFLFALVLSHCCCLCRHVMAIGVM